MSDSGIEREAVTELRSDPQPAGPPAPRSDDRHPFVQWALGLLRLDYTGIAFGAFFFCWSLTPSLLPRNWLFQGLIGGINAAFGYGVGVAIGWVVYEFGLARRSWWPPPPRILRPVKVAVPALSLVAAVVMLIFSAGWQRELSALMNAEGTTTSGYIRTLGLSLVIAGVLISLCRMIRDFVLWVARQLNRRLRIPRPAAVAAGYAVVLVVSFMLVDGILVRAGYAAFNSAFSLQNDSTRPGVVQPVLPEKSGSPQSLASWESLGYQGRNFVAGGIRADELSAANGRPAQEPIRVYAGIETADDTEARMDVVLAELERTGAFERKSLVVIPTTGTGWVNPTAAQAIELVENGDSALVAAQYSYMPSWISFLADRGKAAVAGDALIGAIHERWLTKPEATRPKLYVYGESLGTQAGEGAFDGLADIRETVDGVLWVGPPNSNSLWRAVTERRDPGTPEVQPVYAEGLVVRFADDADAIPGRPQPWIEPRVLYLQHPSDPVVWWSTDLIFDRPDWLEEPPGFDRLPSMRWFPFVTFWQVSADLGNAAGVPDGHGHNYGTAVLDGYVAVTQPAGWTQADTDRVRGALESLHGHDGPEK